MTTVYFQYLITLKQLELANEQLEVNKKIIKLIQVRFGSGQIKGVDILRQRQTLESTKDLKIVYETNKNVLENQLAVLSGVSAQSFETPKTVNLPELPEKPKAGLP